MFPWQMLGNKNFWSMFMYITTKGVASLSNTAGTVFSCNILRKYRSIYSKPEIM